MKLEIAHLLIKKYLKWKKMETQKWRYHALLINTYNFHIRSHLDRIL